MLGLQTQHDIQNISRLRAPESNATRRSNKFVKNLSAAGFSVPGHTNSMKKHTETQQAALSVERKKNLNSKLAQEQFIQKQDEETQNDAKRLADLEAQLAQIQKQKEMRRARDRARRKRRMEYVAACTIVRAFRYFTKIRLGEACMVIKDFLIVGKNTNAITVAKWAASTISNWAKASTTRWHFQRMKRIALALAAKKKAEENLRIGAINLAARNATAKSTIVNVFRNAMVSVAKAEINKRREQSRKERAMRKGWKSKPSPKSKDVPTKSSPSGLFITAAIDSGDENNGSEGPDTATEVIQNARKNFVAPCNVPGVVNGDDRRNAISVAVPDAFDVDMSCLDLGLEDEEAYDEEAVLAKERADLISSRYAELEAQRERERKLRLKNIEIKKARDFEAALKREQEERKRREDAEDARLDWLQEQEERSYQRAQYLTRKRKQEERDAKRERKEIQLMGTHDLRTIENDARKKASLDYIPRRKPKKAREPTEYEIQAAELKRLEAEEEKEKAARAIYLKNKEATERRLREKADKIEKEKERRLKEENDAKERITKLEAARKSALKRAIAAKKVRDEHARQIEKEQKILDLQNKLNSGRTHNAFGKPLGVKGFVVPKRHDLNSRGKPRNNQIGAQLISSNIPVNDPAVEEWNYQVKPSLQEDEASRDESLSSFRFDEFLSNAQEHDLLNVADSLLVGDDSSEFSNPQGDQYWPFGEESNDDGADLNIPPENGNGSENEDIKPTESRNATEEKESEKENSGESVKEKKKRTKPTLKESKIPVNSNFGDPNLAQGEKPMVIDKKTKVVDITGVSHIRQPKIPLGLKDTPYFKSYVTNMGDKLKLDSSKDAKSSKKEKQAEDVQLALMKKQNRELKAVLASIDPSSEETNEMSESSNVPPSAIPTRFNGDLMSPLDMAPPESHPLLAKQTKALRKPVKNVVINTSGKVATLHAAVNHARQQGNIIPNAKGHFTSKRVLEKPSNNSHDRDDTKKMARQFLSADEKDTGLPFKPPPPDLDIQVESPTNIDDTDNNDPLNGSLCDYFFASKHEGDGDESPSIFAQASGGNHFPSPPAGARRNVADSPLMNEIVSPSSNATDSPSMNSKDSGSGSFGGEDENAEERQRERELNAECDALRLKLEAKLGIPHPSSRRNSASIGENGKGPKEPVSARERAPVPVSKVPLAEVALGKPLAARDLLPSKPGPSAYDGNYSIDMNMPDFSFKAHEGLGWQNKLLKEWADEDLQQSTSPSKEE